MNNFHWLRLNCLTIVMTLKMIYLWLEITLASWLTTIFLVVEGWCMCNLFPADWVRKKEIHFQSAISETNFSSSSRQRSFLWEKFEYSLPNCLMIVMALKMIHLRWEITLASWLTTIFLVVEGRRTGNLWPADWVRKEEIHFPLPS